MFCMNYACTNRPAFPAKPKITSLFARWPSVSQPTGRDSAWNRSTLWRKVYWKKVRQQWPGIGSWVSIQFVQIQTYAATTSRGCWTTHLLGKVFGDSGGIGSPVRSTPCRMHGPLFAGVCLYNQHIPTLGALCPLKLSWPTKTLSVQENTPRSFSCGVLKVLPGRRRNPFAYPQDR